jgi:DMSO/TMAO reductase YedYZ molybdopterin-dependent catalytic subunit
MSIINKGFIPKRQKNDRLPPGQYETKQFPVLSLGPTPLINQDEWSFLIVGEVEETKRYTWKEFLKLPHSEITCDIHCVTKWSKFDTIWKGVLIEDLMKQARVKQSAKYLIAYSYDGYSTNIPIEDVLGKQAMIATSYDEKQIPAEHGGPARLLVPHLYFWKSAKWVRGIEFSTRDEPGFWETRGYHNYGDPWKEQRYSSDK